jgi:galactokinase
MDLTSLFKKTFQQEPTVLVRAPGRVNLLGEHVDYNDGPVLPAALDLEVSMAAGPLPGDQVNIYALDLVEMASFRLSSLDLKLDIQGRPLSSWALYPAGVAWSLNQAGLPAAGLQAVFTSDIPIGAGLSSSAAVEVSFALAWQALAGWKTDRMTLARLCQQAENEYVGVSSGLMDQFASLHGVEGHALYLDTRSLDWSPVPFPAGVSIMIADSGVRRSLSGSAYNERRAACEEAVAFLRSYLPDLRSLRDISPPEFAAYSDYMPELLRRRAEHVVREIHRVETAVTALKRGEARSFGKMMYAGHTSLRDLYQVSIPEIDTLVEIARDLPGCLGARLTGAGFGGCTVNLVEEQHAEQFSKNLQQAYKSQMKRECQVYQCRTSAGASVKRL